MKKAVCLFIAALMALSLFGCRATTRSRLANVPYAPYHTARQPAVMPGAYVPPRTNTNRAATVRPQAPAGNGYTPYNPAVPNATDADWYYRMTQTRPTATPRPRSRARTHTARLPRGGALPRNTARVPNSTLRPLVPAPAM